MLTYSVDDAGRLAQVAAPGVTYADLTVAAQPYAADGRIAQMRLGNQLWETREHRTPGTPTRWKLGTTAGSNDRIELEYNYAATANNGNLVSHVIRQPGFTRTQNYTYDSVNRLGSAQESGGFSRTYGYDRWGNRWVSGSSGLTYANPYEPTAASNFNPATNRINVAGVTFDAAGNQHYPPYALVYDAESRPTAASSASNGNAAYLYDGDGRRVRKVWTPHGGTAVTTYYIYNIYGQMAAEYMNTALPATGRSYIFTDRLGSVRAVSGGKPPSGHAVLTECHDYLPFGRPLSRSDHRSGMNCYPANPEATLSSALPQKFTGQEREEIRLDFFQARYMSPGQGRFTSADPLSGWVDDPQSWNMYSYARNNPLLYSDPNGTNYEICADGGRCFEIPDHDYSSYIAEFGFFGYRMPERAGVTPINACVNGGSCVSVRYLDQTAMFIREMDNRASASNQMLGAGAVAGVTGGATLWAGGAVSAGSWFSRLGLTTIRRESVRTAPRSLAEKLTLDEAKGGAGRRIMQGKIKDPIRPEE